MAIDDALQLGADRLRELPGQLQDELLQARSDMETPLSEIREWREQLKANQRRENPPYPGASEVVPPFIKGSLLSIFSEVSPSILNVKPFAHYEPAGVGQDYSHPWEDFHQALTFERMKAWAEYKAWIFAGLRDGSAILAHDWHTETRMLPAWEETTTTEIDPLFGRPVPVKSVKRKVTVPTVIYDLPRVRYIPIDQFCCYPAHDADIQASEGVAVQYTVTGNYILDGMAQGKYDEKAGYKLLDATGSSPSIARPEDTEFGVETGGGNVTSNPKRNPLVLTECYWRLPSETKGDPWQDWLIVFEEEHGIIIRAVPMPWAHGLRPYVACRPYANIRGILGDGVAASGAGHTQEMLMVLYRYAQDAMAWGVNPRQLVDATLYQQIKTTFQKENRPGGLIPMPTSFWANGGRGMTPFTPGYSPNDIIPFIENVRKNIGQEATGKNDTMSGQQMPGVDSATEAQFIEQGSKKVMAMLTENVAQATNDSVQMVHELVKQFADHESVAGLWAKINAKVVSQQTGQPVSLEEACQTEYTVTANGISETSNRIIIAQRSKERTGFLAQLPEVMQDPKLSYRWAYDALKDGGNPNPEDHIGTEDEWIAKRQAMMQAQMDAAKMQQEQELMGQLMPPQGGQNG